MPAEKLQQLVRFGLERPWVTGVSFQPATYSGRHVLPEDLERRITFPDVIVSRSSRPLWGKVSDSWSRPMR